jgi:hypothetical protein
MTDAPEPPPAPAPDAAPNVTLRFTQSLAFSSRSMRNLAPPAFMGPGFADARTVASFRTPAAILSGFPRSGRTWLRVMLAHAFEELFHVSTARPWDTDALAKVEPRVPRIVVTPGIADPRTRAPSQLPRNLDWARGQRIVLLVRDPRDLAVSLYFERVHRARFFPAELRRYDGTLAEFLREDVGSLRTIVEYMNIWAASRAIPATIRLVTYEHLLADTALEFGRLLDFVGLDATPEFVESLVRSASFDQMRRLEVSGRLGYKPSADLMQDERGLVLRRGLAGGYKDHFTKPDHDYVAEVMAGLDGWYGYSG